MLRKSRKKKAGINMLLYIVSLIKTEIETAFYSFSIIIIFSQSQFFQFFFSEFV